MRKKLLAFTLASAMLFSTFSGMSALAAPSSLPELTSVDELESIIVQTGTPLDDVVTQLPAEVGITLVGHGSVVLFEDDFSDPDQSRANWEIADPNNVVTFEPGKMKLGASTNVKAVVASADAKNWTNYAVEAEITGPQNPSNNFGVMFRCSNVTTSGPDSYNGYYAGIGSTTSGLGFVAGYADGGWHQISSTTEPGYIGGQLYTLKVLVAGNSFQAYINGEKVYEYTDERGLFQSGTAGVRAYNVPFEMTSFTVRTLTADERAEMDADVVPYKTSAAVSGWSCPDFDMSQVGEYTFTGSISGNFTNPAGMTASMKVYVMDAPPSGDVTPEYETDTPITIIADWNPGVEHDVNPYIKGNQMYLFLPAKASLGALNVTALDDIVLNGVSYPSGSTVSLSLDGGKTVTCIANGVTYTLSAMQSKLPTLYLNIDESQGTIAAMNGDPAHETKCYGDLVLDVPEDVAALKGWETQYALKMSEIKGRGNSTWTQPKKPYQIKLDKKTNLLGMGKHKTWIILANYMDSSLIRNRLVYNAGAEAGMEFSIDNEYIDVYMNGKYLGNYQLTEKVQVGENRVEVTDIDDIVDETGALPENITGGYLLEMDFRARSEAYHFSTPKFYHLEVKSPERDGATLDYISQYVSDFENALYSADGYNDKGVYYADYIDLDSFVTYYFFQEFIKNWDCMYSYGSIYFHKDVDGPLVAGPYWDFDWTMDARHVPDYRGLFHTTEGWLGQIVDRSEHTSNEMWWRQFWKHEDFVIRLTELYEEKLGDIVAGWPEDIAAYNEELGVSATMNDIMWPYNLSHQDNVQSIVNFVQGRYEWIDNAVTELPVVSFQGGEGTTGDAPASLYAEKDETFKLPENPFAKAGFTFAGWSDGANTYAAGADYTKASDGRLIFTAVWEESSQPVDKSLLETAIGLAKKMIEDYDLTQESIDMLAGMIEEAEALLQSDASQNEIDAMYDKIIKTVAEVETGYEKAHLKDIITSALKLDQNRYTPSSWAPVAAALKVAQEVVADQAATADDVRDAYTGLLTAMSELQQRANFDALNVAYESAITFLENGQYEDAELANLKALTEDAAVLLKEQEATQSDVDDLAKAITTEMRKIRLHKAVTQVEAQMAQLDFSLYTDASVAALQSALDHANALLAAAELDAAEAEKAETALFDAFSHLELKEQPSDVDKSLLEAMIAAIDGKYDAERYTEESFAALTEALDAAQDVVDNKAATQKDVFDAYLALVKARDGLVYAVDTSLLELAVELAQDLLDDENFNLTDESIAALTGAIEEAEALLQNGASQEEINACYENVMQTITEVSEREPVDKSILEKLLKMAAEVTREKYTTSSLEALDDAVAAAQPVMEDDGATEEQVKAAEDALTEALNNLKLKANFAILESAVATAQEIVDKAEDQTALTEVNALLGEAKNLLQSEEATQEEINELATKLTRAAALVRLAEVVNAAEASLAELKPADYTAESWNTLESAVAELKALEENDELTVELVNAANDVVLAAFDGLDLAEQEKPVDPTPSKTSKGSVSKASDSDYWDGVTEKIGNASEGDTISVKLQDGQMMPATVLDQAKAKKVKLNVEIAGKEHLIVNIATDSAAVYYSGAELIAMAGGEAKAPAVNSNPETGGEVTATMPNAAPEATVPVEPVVPEAPAVIEPAAPAEAEAPAAQIAPAAQAESGLPVWAIVVIAVAAAAVIGGSVFAVAKRNASK